MKRCWKRLPILRELCCSLPVHKRSRRRNPHRKGTERLGPGKYEFQKERQKSGRHIPAFQFPSGSKSRSAQKQEFCPRGVYRYGLAAVIWLVCPEVIPGTAGRQVTGPFPFLFQRYAACIIIHRLINRTYQKRPSKHKLIADLSGGGIL